MGEAGAVREWGGLGGGGGGGVGGRLLEVVWGFTLREGQFGVLLFESLFLEIKFLRITFCWILFPWASFVNFFPFGT